MQKTYTTEEVISRTGGTPQQVYLNANRYGWSEGIEKPSHKQKLYSAAKVEQYVTARAITDKATELHGYGKHAPLLWAVTTCPTCGGPAAYFKRLSKFCINGHTTGE